MRVLALSVLMVVGCSGQEEESACSNCAQGDADTDSDTDPDTVVTPSEICDDGIDNDGDGLLDCEDGDCVYNGACVGETACDDGLDNDADGRTDCMDDDCWGHGCAVTAATLASANHAIVQSRVQIQTAFGSPSCVGQSIDTSLTFGLASASGTVRHMPASTPVWSTCTWTADQTTFVGTLSGAIGTPVARSGFAIEPGCALTTSGFLPQYMAHEYLYNGRVAFKTREDANGDAWATFALSPNNIDVNTSSYVNAGSPCSTSVFNATLVQQLPNVVGAAGYLETTP